MLRMVRTRRLLAASASLLLVASGCKAPAPATVPSPNAPAATGDKPGARASSRPGVAPSAVAVPADALARATAGLAMRPMPGAAELVGKVRLIGKVRLLSEQGGAIISDNGGGIISDNGGGVISNNSGAILGNNGGSIMSNNGSGLIGKVRYGVRQAQTAGRRAELALAEAVVTVHDA